METIGQLTEKQYFAWKNKLLELQVVEKNAKIVDLQFALMEKDIEVAKLKSLIFKENVRNRHSDVQTQKREYTEFKQELSKEVDFSLENVIIDEITYEVKIDAKK